MRKIIYLNNSILEIEENEEKKETKNEET